MEVDFGPVLGIPEVPVLQAFRGISHFVWYCKAVSDLSPKKRYGMMTETRSFPRRSGGEFGTLPFFVKRQ